jgi:hypothetical protein
VDNFSEPRLLTLARRASHFAGLATHRKFVSDRVPERIAQMAPRGVGLIDLGERIAVGIALPPRLCRFRLRLCWQKGWIDNDSGLERQLGKSVAIGWMRRNAAWAYYIDRRGSFCVNGFDRDIHPRANPRQHSFHEWDTLHR